MKALDTLITTLGLVVWGGNMSAAHLQPHLQFSARMNGAQEVPAVVTDALGVASFTLNGTRDTLCIRTNFTGLSGPLAGAHIHRGASGTNGPVIVDLSSFVSGNSLDAVLTGADLTAELIAMHVRGDVYLNVHTMSNPNGEIRGQIIPETDIAFVADLSGMQEVPMVTTDGMGMATFLLAKHNGLLSYRIVLNGLSGPIQAAHLHAGAMGSNGGVVYSLAGDIVGNTIVGSTDPAAFLVDLMAGNIYVNVHTMANPGGEIRGQVGRAGGLAFDSYIDGAQQVPINASGAQGVASIVATADLDSVWYAVQLDGLSGPVQAAHLHLAGPGSNGDVVVDLSTGIMGNRLQGWFVTTGLGDELLSELLKGNIYINIHTAANPLGEVRGQVYRYMREGYTVQLSGMEQVPSNGSTATGGGIVTVDRAQSNAHIMIVTDASMVNAAHLHMGAPGTNGSVVYDLGPYLLNNGIFAYWTGSDAATPFVTANSVQLRNNELYANVHTDAIPLGEVRGQVRRGSPCSNVSTGLTELRPTLKTLNAYPVPSSDRITVVLDAGTTITSAEIYNAQGQQFTASSMRMQSGQLEVDIIELAQGAYTLLLRTNDDLRTARFIKQ